MAETCVVGDSRRGQLQSNMIKVPVVKIAGSEMGSKRDGLPIQSSD